MAQSSASSIENRPIASNVALVPRGPSDPLSLLEGFWPYRWVVGRTDGFTAIKRQVENFLSWGRGPAALQNMASSAGCRVVALSRLLIHTPTQGELSGSHCWVSPHSGNTTRSPAGVSPALTKQSGQLGFAMIPNGSTRLG